MNLAGSDHVEEVGRQLAVDEVDRVHTLATTDPDQFVVAMTVRVTHLLGNAVIDAHDFEQPPRAEVNLW